MPRSSVSYDVEHFECALLGCQSSKSNARLKFDSLVMDRSGTHQRSFRGEYPVPIRSHFSTNQWCKIMEYLGCECFSRKSYTGTTLRGNSLEKARVWQVSAGGKG